MSADDFEQDLLEGLAQFLQAEGVGIYRSSGAGYANGEVGIVIEAAPETLNRAIQLGAYVVDEDTTFGSDVLGVQIVTRWEGADPFPCKRLDTQIFNRLQGRTFTLPTGVEVRTCSRRSGASLGLDGSKRWSRSSNYYLRVYRPTTYRL